MYEEIIIEFKKKKKTPTKVYQKYVEVKINSDTKYIHIIYEDKTFNYNLDTIKSYITRRSNDRL
jgi:hypothetical protein